MPTRSPRRDCRALTRYPLARAAARKAVELDDSSADAHNALAFVTYKSEWKWADAEREFKRAIELNPNLVLARHWYAEMLGLIGRYDDADGAVPPRASSSIRCRSPFASTSRAC